MRKRITITNLPVSITRRGSVVQSEVIGSFSFLLQGDPEDVGLFIDQLQWKRFVIRIRKGRIKRENLKIEKVSD